MALRIDFLNVGHGDCTVIRHDSGNITVVDINNGGKLDPTTVSELAQQYNVDPLRALLFKESMTVLLKQKGYSIPLTDPVDFLGTTYQAHPIFRYVQTHPDMDHMRGLVAVRKSGISIINFWDRDHDKIPDFQSDSDRDEWAEYERLRKGENGNKVLRLYRDFKGTYWNENPTGVTGGDGIRILHPTPDVESDAKKSGDTNNISYVLLINYRGIKIILGGDAEQEAWDGIVEKYGGELKCHVLMASHHGRDSGYHAEAVKLMAPDYTVVSVGKKPDTDASNKYRQYSKNVWSTRWRGNITLTVDDQGKGTINSEYER